MPQPKWSLFLSDPPRQTGSRRAFLSQVPRGGTGDPIRAGSSLSPETYKQELDGQLARRLQRRFYPRRQVGSKTQTHPALQLPVTFPNLSFFIHKMGVRIVCTSQSSYEDYIRECVSV